MKLAAAGLAIVLCACGRPGSPEGPQATGGDAERGAEIIREISCGSCHTIPGIGGADGLVGPPLTAWSRRAYIAGNLPNTAPNLVRWISDAHTVEPGTAMPDLDISEAEARDVAAYLYTLR